MVLARFNSTPMLSVTGKMDRLFDDVLRAFPVADPWHAVSGRKFPALNVWEDDQTLYAEAELPGLKMDELELYVSGDELTIKGERTEAEDDKVNYHRRERGVGTFSRVVRLPVEVDAENVEASLSDGVLAITLPKAQTALPRKIEIKG